MSQETIKKSLHDCLEHNRRFPEHPMLCYGNLCSDCPFKEEFRKRGLIKK